MSAKVCPTCAATWGAEYRFCPADGEALVAVVAAAAQVLRRLDRPADRLRTAPTEVRMPATAEEPPKKGGKRNKPAFSETAWFMHKIDPTMVDPETGRVIADTTKGSADAVDPETRKKYSLRTENEE